MRLHIIHPLWLLGLPIVLAIKQVLSQNGILYQELNIYPYQGIYLECEGTGTSLPVLPTPLDKGEAYVENPLKEESPGNLKTARESKKLEGVFPELKFFPNGKKYTLYYTAPGKHEKIETIYFECIGAVPDVTNIIQLSIMPEEKYLPKEEHLVLDKVPVPKGKELAYLKQITLGVKTVTECKNSELILNDGIDVSVKKPEVKAYTNPVTMVEYQDITDYVTKHTATKNTHIIDLMDGRVANISDGDLVIYCKESPDNKLVYTSPYTKGIPGLHAYYRPDDVLDDGSRKLIQIKTEKDTQVLVDVPIKTGAIFPNDCLNNVFTATGKVVKMSKIVRNAKLARITDSFKILDLSTSSSYREITVSCFVNGSQRGVWSKGVWMNVTISPQCNFYDKEALDSDGKTCTVFASSYADSLVATPMDSLESPETFELEEAFFTRSDDPKGTCKDCHYKKIVEQDDGISVSVTKGVDNQKIKIMDGVIKHNPVYILRKEEVKGDDEVVDPTHALRMYLHNHEVDIDDYGKVTVEDKFKVNKAVGKSAFYRVHIDGHKRIAISCKDFFEDSGPSEPILLPSGNNTIFENVSDGDADPRTIKTAEFKTLFQSRGIRILKKPAPGVDLEILAVPESVIQSDHHRPIYFICSTDVQGDWKSNKKPYAVIAIDPGYMYDGQQDLPEEEDPPIVIDDPPDQPEEEGALLEPKQVLDVDTTSIDEHGKVTIEKKHQVKSGGKSILYRVQPGDKRDIKISCKDFFEDSGSSGYTLLPNGKNTIFENVSDGAVDPKKIKTAEFEKLFQSKGITIVKKPEPDVDLEIKISTDKVIKSDHRRPIYFICAQNVEWEKDKKPYAVIAIDPGYEIRKLQGCGVKSGMFLGQGESSITGNQCMHTVDDETRIGFHCPSYVPEHFLEGDQSKHKAAEDAKAENPYQLLLRCYDRSTVGKRMFRPKRNLGLFSRPKFAGELRSLWVFDRNTFAEKKHLTDILCTCYDKTGKAISHIKIKNNSNKATDSL